MNKQRRLFLNQLSVMAGVAVFSKPLASFASVSKNIYSLRQNENAVTIYHSNDLHGQFEVVHDNTGGIRQLENLLSKQETKGLLLDAGDFLDGSGDFSHQQNVIYAMNQMGYHAAAVGNNELARGQEYLAGLVPYMKFKLVNCNYRFDNVLSTLVKQYIIVNSGKFKIGITGVGHKLKGITYTDAIQCANETARRLKQIEKCDLVICLSHLGYKQNENKPDNIKLAAQSENIDLIVSGHNRKLLKNHVIKLNKLKKEVIISHSAWDGLTMGKTVIGFDDRKEKNCVNVRSLIAGQPYGATPDMSFFELQANQKRLV
jgi:5'-nucleotidase